MLRLRKVNRGYVWFLINKSEGNVEKSTTTGRKQLVERDEHIL